MILAMLTCISITLLAVCWFVYRRYIELFLCILITIYSEFFYLIPQLHRDPRMGVDDYKIMLLPVLVILLIENIIKGKFAMGRYGWLMITFLIISLFDVIVASFYGQDLILGLKAAKYAPLVAIYFILAGRSIDANKFVKYFILMSLAVTAVATVQYLLHGRMNLFSGLPIEKFSGNVFERSAVFRVTVGQFIIPVAALLALARYAQSSRLINLFSAIVLLMEVLFIQQTRMLIAALVVSMVIVYALSNKLTALRLSVYFMFAGALVILMLVFSVSDFKEISLVKRTTTDIEQRKGSYQARVNAYDYYWKEIKSRPIAGQGILNFNWEGNNERKLQQLGMHLSDIGIIHFIVQAGIIGFLWLMWVFAKVWRDAFRFRKHQYISSYFVIATFTSPTIDMFLRSDSLFLFAAFLGVLSSTISTAKINITAKDA
jgi:hypothetical protein